MTQMSPFRKFLRYEESPDGVRAVFSTSVENVVPRSSNPSRPVLHQNTASFSKQQLEDRVSNLEKSGADASEERSALIGWPETSRSPEKTEAIFQRVEEHCGQTVREFARDGGDLLDIAKALLNSAITILVGLYGQQRAADMLIEAGNRLRTEKRPGSP